jgi:hypothetical protein
MLVDPRARLDDVEKILYPTGTRIRPLGHPARRQSLYRLRYPGSLFWSLTLLKLSGNYVYHLL